MASRTTSRREQARSRRDAAVAASAARQMADTRFDVVRSPGRRRALAVALLVALGLTSTLYWLGNSLLGTVVLVLAVGLWLVLRVAVRTLADLPEEYLDERQERVRNQAYLESYRILSTVVVLAVMGVMLAYIVSGSDPDSVSIELTLDRVQAVFWAVIGLSLSLPSILVAWRERDI